jgi:hypothetical protein
LEGREDKRPTRANIIREFKTLAKNAKPDDQVFILLGGHGCQTPNHSSPDPEDVEPDGLDETFCPADTRLNKDGDLVNMIVDDEIRELVGDITAKGAAVCLVVDACHSGTVLRGPVDEVSRRIDIKKLGLESAFEEARERGRKKFGSMRGAFDSSSDAGDVLDNVTAIYAAQSDEVEIEMPFGNPKNPKESKSYGLLAYKLCEAINSNGSKRPLTYRELVDRIRLQYARMGRDHPTPCVEGKNIDKELLGLKEWPRPSRFLLKQAKDTWTLEAGKIHGLTEGSILAVYREPGDEAPAGHVKIESIDVFKSEVEPCAYAEKPLVADLPMAAYCEPAFVQFDNLRLQILAEAVEGAKSPKRLPVPATVTAALKRLASAEKGLIEVATNPSSQCWRVQVEGNNFYLVPPQGQLETKANGERSDRGFGPAPLAALEPQLKKWLDQIARVELLKKLPGEPAADLARGFGDESMGLEVKVFKHKNEADKAGTLYVPGPEGPVLNEGEIVSFEVTNASNRAIVYVTLLMIDSGYGVESLYPLKGEVAEKVRPGKSFKTDQFTVDVKTAGKEHLLAIAIKATGDAVDFTSLEQPTIQMARDVSNTQRGDADDPLDSPLGKLMQYSLYAEGNTRGLSRGQIDDHVMGLVTWTTRPKATANASGEAGK